MGGSMEKEKLRQLVDEVGKRLTVVAAPKPRQEDAAAGVHFDEVTRNAVISRIRDLQRMFGLGWLVRQETFHVPALECLESDELSALLSDMERARECLVEGIDIEHTDLIRSRSLD